MKVLFLCLLAVFFTSADAQLLKGALKKVSDKMERNPVQDILKKPASISTSLDNVKMEGALEPSFGNDSTYKELTALPRTANGGFTLKTGFYQFHDQSYCLKAGTHGPGGGDGYMFAPPLGPKEEIVVAIVRNSFSHPGIHQHDIQLLLWSIIAHTKFEDLQANIKLAASQLLTPSQLLDLNGGVVGLVPDALMQKGMDGLPPAVRSVMEAENKLRGMLTNANSSYEEMERVAVLAGVAPVGEGSREMPSGKWTLHPDGYYVRYLPFGYTNTKVQIWVPKGTAAVGKEYDPAMHIAVPGNTARQRLIQSGRSYKE
jgi:hypothetical protein